MNRLTRIQRDKVLNFKAITSSTEHAAIECLSASGWDMESGIDLFFSTDRNLHTVSISSRKAIDDLFHLYSECETDIILADGISRLCEDLGVDPADIVLLVLSWHMNAATMCEYTKEEFTTGLIRLGCDSLAKLKACLPTLKSELDDEGKFKEIYLYAFMFSREKGQKCLQLETAIAMWKLIFRFRPWALIDEWCDFLLKNHN